MRISLELVPRSPAALVADAELVRARFPWITMLNVPDLLRFPLRSWHACAQTAALYSTSVPHLRAVDIDPAAPLPMAAALAAASLTEVLVVTGDPSDNPSHRSYPQTSVDVIRRFKRELPTLRVYAGIDPYRQSLRRERDDIGRKRDAGADGFFTQPFFDRRLLEIYADDLADDTVFWGISPVLSPASRSYWETKNNVVFPAAFEPTMEWNQTFAATTLTHARATKQNAYLMPIRIDLATYLGGIDFGTADSA